MKSTLGQRVKLLRDEYRLNQTDFGTKAGITLIAVGRIENGETSNPQRATIDKIVEAFGTTHDWLLNGKGEMLPKGKVDVSVGKSGISINPYRDYLIQKLEGEIEYYRTLLSQIAGSGGFQLPVNNSALRAVGS